MTSKEEPKPSSGEERRRSPLDHLPPPANSNKPLTPFSIEDILNKPSVRRSYTLCGTAHLLSAAEKHPPAGLPLSGRALLSQTSPLCALEELASKTFKGLEVSVLQAAEGRDGMTIFGQRQTPKKRRKSRTAFTNHQIYELEKRFLYQKYLSPADRDQIAQQLGLTNAQVITWFQNRRAKLKRDLEEMKADVESAKKLGPNPAVDIVALAELEPSAEGRGKARSASPPPPPSAAREPGAPPPPRPASPPTERPRSRRDSEEEEEEEEEDVEIDVDD
ncbi:transcription factor LBX1 [Gavia stellata]|uniref:transcription factor LBX1 n=1 Tax=Gavia stellata TaxID=37040 RepID=UPI00289BD756|nr:transcription factor LBX1 [Gavia stellata]